ncbi:threonylcarbamoyl-AMP synthase [Candidatus Thorarchaeota archaeon]|nr:MAG: threonylcarbamoyl-AMP synthase [Candidatus Thorarchaeota archaeon]
MTAEIMKVDDLDNYDHIIARAVEVVQSGGIIVYPTDTSYGLGCDPRIPEALDRLVAVKRRDRKVGVPLLFNDYGQCETYHEFGSLEKIIVRLFWPGALTIIVDARPEIPEHITIGGRSIAIRVPNHVIPRAIANKIGGPVVGTSANRTGGASPFDVSVAMEQLGQEVDLYIDGGLASASNNSTIIGVEDAGEGEVLNIKVYREGAIAISQLEEMLNVDSDARRFWTSRIIYPDM